MALVTEVMGAFGKYHFWLCFMLFINKFGIAFHQMAIIFLAPPVHFTCPAGKKTCCDHPIYDKSIHSRTIVMEWNLICNRSWLKDFNQFLFQFGVLLGSLLAGIASDRFGRRPILIISVILEVFTGIMASFLPDYWSFTLMRMITGFSVGGVMVIGFVILMEYVGSEYRTVISALYQVPFTGGNIILALFGYLIRDYVYFQLGISLTNIILLLYICILPESPRWLLAVNKTTEAVKQLERVAKINKLPTEDIHQKMELYQLERKRLQAKKASFFDLFRTPNIRKNILVMSFIWLACSYCFYGVSHYVSHLTGDIYINVISSGSVCFIACVISIPLMKYFKRKTVVIFANVGCGISLLIIAFIPESVVSTILGCCGVFFSFTVFIVVYLYCSEMFPTVVRNAAIGMSSMMARLGSMIAPFVANFKEFGKWYTPVAFAIFPLVAALLCLLLPETKGCELMVTIEEAEAFGKRQRRGDQQQPDAQQATGKT